MTAKAPEDTGTPIVKEWRWTRSGKCTWLARSQLRKQLLAWGVSEYEESAVLLLSELFTNALRYRPPGTQIVTRFMLYPDRFRLEVDDASESVPFVQKPSDDDESGRGLLLVEALADKWDVTPRTREGFYAPGKTVWFELYK